MRKLAVLLSLIMVLGIAAPVFANEGMSEALMTVKSRVVVPEDCTEFQGYPETQDGKRAWSFEWTTPRDAETHKTVYATIDENGIISRYHYYDERLTNEPYYTQKRIPTYSEAEAAVKAKAYMERINPSVAAEFDFSKAVTTTGLKEYALTVPRVVNGIVFKNNNAYFSINHQDGGLISFSLGYNADVSFPAADHVITPETAAVAFKKNGGLELIYTNFYNYEAGEDGKTAKVVYAPTGKGGVIDALTGEPSNVVLDYYPGPEYGVGLMKDAAAPLKTGNEVQLTEKEIEGIEKLSGIISPQDGEKIIRAMPELRMPEGLQLRSSRVSEYGDKYVIYLNFESTEENNYNSVSVSLNAKTGELMSFYCYDYKMGGGTKKHTEDEAKKVVEAFVAKYFGKYAANIALQNASVEDYSNSYNVYYNRVHNGLPYYGNTLNISVNLETLKVTSFSVNWSENILFESVDGLIGEEAAYEKLFSLVSPQLSYALEKSGSKTAKLVYSINTNGIACIEAKTGLALNHYGDEYKAPAPIAYSDLEGHYAKEAVMALAGIGVYLDGELFMPDKIITQKEFLQLVSKCVWDYYPMYGGKVDAESIYKNAISNGVIQKGEEAPDSPLTRELAVAYLLRAMGFKHFAEIKGIFRCSFTDQNEIGDQLFGYVAIAEGLGIINGSDGAFMPKREMTRAEAVTMLYNYLKK